MCCRYGPYIHKSVRYSYRPRNHSHTKVKHFHTKERRRYGAAQHSTALACRHTPSTRRQSRARLLDMTEADTPFTGLLVGLSRFPIFRQVVKMVLKSSLRLSKYSFRATRSYSISDSPSRSLAKTSSRWNTRRPTRSTL